MVISRVTHLTALRRNLRSPDCSVSRTESTGVLMSVYGILILHFQQQNPTCVLLVLFIYLIKVGQETWKTAPGLPEKHNICQRALTQLLSFRE